MSNYEGKTHHRRRGNVDLIDLLFYDAFGETIPPDTKKDILSSMEDNKKKESSAKGNKNCEECGIILGEHSQKCAGLDGVDERGAT